MDVDALVRKAGPQVAGVTIHHADQPGDVVGEFCAGTIDERIDPREQVGEVDATADRADGRERPLENRAGLVGIGKTPTSTALEVNGTVTATA
jgi:hypothetical protein